MKFLDPRRDPPQSYFSCSLFLGISVHNGCLLFFHPNLHIKQRRSPEEFFDSDEKRIFCDFFLSSKFAAILFHHSSGLGRRLPCYNNQPAYHHSKRGNLFKSSWAARWYSWRKRGPSSVQLGNKEVPKARLILEELSSSLLLDQKDWTTKQRFSCGRTFSNSKSLHILLFILQVESKRSSYYKPW